MSNCRFKLTRKIAKASMKHEWIYLQSSGSFSTCYYVFPWHRQIFDVKKLQYFNRLGFLKLLILLIHIKKICIPSSSNDVNRNQMVQSSWVLEVLLTENFLNYRVYIDGIKKDFKFRKASFIPNFKKKACNVGSQIQVLVLSAGTHLP